jgi:hypothetical protein
LLGDVPQSLSAATRVFARNQAHVPPHLAFFTTATVVIAFNYLLNRTPPFFGWLWTNDYAVYVALAAVRLLAGGFLIGGMQGTDKR